MGQLRDFGRRAKPGQRVDRIGTNVGGPKPAAAVNSGLQWPIVGRRPAVPVEDWVANSELGLAWGAEIGAWDIVTLVRGGGKVWADATDGGRGSGKYTGASEPDWTDSQPISDGDYDWYEVPSLAYWTWEAAETLAAPTLIYKEGRAWITYPPSTGDTGAMEPDWAAALAAEDYVADGDLFWWPFPPAEIAITLDPTHGHVIVKALELLDALQAHTGDTNQVRTAITSALGLRLDLGGASVHITTDDGESIQIIRGDSVTGEGSTPDESIAGRVDLLAGGFPVVQVVGTGGTINAAVRGSLSGGEVRGSPFLAVSGLDSSAPTLTGLGSSNRAVAFWVNEAGNKLMFRVLYADGTTQKSGEIALT